MFTWKEPIYRFVFRGQIEDLIEELKENIKQDKPIAIDIETAGPFKSSALSPYHGWILGISFFMNNKKGYYIPINHTKNGKRLENQYTIKELRDILNPIIKKGLYIGHNIKFDYKFLYKAGFRLNPRFWDTRIALQIIKGNAWAKTSLKYSIKKYVNIPHDLVQTFDEASGGDQSEQDIDVFGVYAINDVVFTYYLYRAVKPEIDRDYFKLFYEMEMPLVPLLAQIELRGICIDAKYLRNLKEPINKYRGQIKKFFETHYNVNVASPSQVGKLINDKYKVELPTSKKGNISTSVDVLKEIKNTFKKNSEVHKIARRVLAYRSLDKLLNTYIENYLNLSEKFHYKNKYIHHTDYNQLVNSGRLSSSPNIQNIPRNEHFDIRKAFIPRDGYVFVVADWSGQELRLAAVVSEEPLLKNAYLKNPIDADLHTFTASRLFDISEDKVTPEQRHIGKTINFSLLYGATEIIVSKTLGCSRNEAMNLIIKYYDTYKRLKKWKDSVREQILSKKYVKTLFGRVRYVDETKYIAGEIRALTNHIIQGTGADLLKFSMVKMTKEFAKNNIDAYIVSNTHDEIVVETTQPEEVSKIMKKVMEVKIKDIFFPVDLNIRKSFSKKDIISE